MSMQLQVCNIIHSDTIVTGTNDIIQFKWSTKPKNSVGEAMWLIHDGWVLINVARSKPDEKEKALSATVAQDTTNGFH